MRKSLLYSFVLLALGILGGAPPEKTLASTPVPVLSLAGNESPRDTVAGQKSPWLAGTLSLVVPGLGQWYNGQLVWKGLLFAGAWVGGVQLIGSSFSADFSHQNTGVVVGFGIVAITYVWSILDAVLTSIHLNSEAREIRRPTPDIQSGLQLGPLRLMARPPGPGAPAKVTFLLSM